MTKAEYNHRWYIQNKKRSYKNFKTYNRSFFGKIVRMYLNMQQRVRGQDKKRPNYKGLPIIDRKVFYKWLLNDPRYFILWHRWRSSGYQLRVTPTIDRLDKSKGYVFPNMEVVTLSENVKRRDSK